ncbi:WLM domain-containing protein [Melampsora americana]|nr:WLM domain-containing protein [Melampsora americana]
MATTDDHHQESNQPSLSFSLTHHQSTKDYHSISLQISLYELCHSIIGFNLPPSTLFKLIIKGKTHSLISPSSVDSKSLESLGFEEKHYKILLITTSSEDVKRTEAFEILKQKKLKAQLNHNLNPVTLFRTPTAQRDQTPFKFYRIEILPNSEFETERRALLERLTLDPSVKKVMIEHQFTVLHLGELHPITHPTILGVNENSGQSIKLRLLTDRLDGLRSYAMVRRVLCHELAHNRFGHHLNEFKELDSSINRMMLAHDRLLLASSHRLGGDLGHHYQPEQDLNHHCQTSSPSKTSNTLNTLGHQLNDSVMEETEQPRDPKQAAAAAALKRANAKSPQ